MRVSKRYLAPALLTLVLPLGLASPANASAERVFAGSCSSGNFCLFENNDFNNGNTNHWRDITHNDRDFRGNHWRDGNGWLTDDDMNDETSSVKNRTGGTVCLYQNPGYTGDRSGFADGADDGYLANNDIEDNSASAAEFARCRD
ncbi:peptidase inhibitor family I36 protein [Streptomyces sp. NPDC053750]|uniref:peptidase inhibitor family I36 protein n=1 Tax=Streptomyces sp. NPDC053750 TaxID=3365714 RepID=UPI0037D95061